MQEDKNKSSASDHESKTFNRLSLSKMGKPSRFSGSPSRTVTVEVKRKKVSLLDKKQALESGTPLSERGTPRDMKQALAGTHSLTNTELDARLRALKNAASLQEQVPEHEQVPEEVLEPEQIVEPQEEELIRVQEEAQDETPQEAVQEEAVPEQPEEPVAVVEPEVVAPKPEIKKKEEPVVPKPKPVVPVILRAASYGPSQRQLEKERIRKQAEKAAAESKQQTNARSQRPPKTESVPDILNEVPQEIGRPVNLSRKTTKSASEDFDRGEANSRRTNKRGMANTQRKLTRHVLTRVMDDEDEERSRSVAAYRRAQKKRAMAGANKQPAAKVIRDVTIADAITVGELANRMAVSSSEVIKALMKLGTLASINQVIDGDTAELLCVEFGHRPKRVSDADIEIGLERAEDNPEDLLPRPPVITVMGHVDHGKTSLLDALRKTDVVATEFGGITQHIGAYQIVTKYSDQKITFLDTPGHAAFSAMRARGANITDIAVIVVAADDGVNEQTLEALAHAKAANAPMIIAINKIDKKTADPQRIRNELLTHEVLLEEFGGDVMAVEISAKMGTNLDKLVEAILLQADMMELKANPNGQAEGVVLEAAVDKGRGVVATVLIQRGTLRPGDIFVAGAEFGRVKRMMDSRGSSVKEAPPSYPVEILGFNNVPMAGDKFCVVETEQRAREVAEYRRSVRQEKEALARNKNSIAHMMDKIAVGKLKELPIVLKADVQGSLEAITTNIAKLEVNGVRAHIIHGAIGDINETDVLLGKASEAVVLGFNVKATPQAKSLAHFEGIGVEHFAVIYELLDRVEKMMKGLLEPTWEEKDLGVAEVRVVFSKGKVIKIAGCYVTRGVIRRANTKVRLRRGDKIVFTGKIDSMKHQQDDIKESRESHDCGIILDGWNDIQEGDTIECFEMVEVKSV